MINYWQSHAVVPLSVTPPGCAPQGDHSRVSPPRVPYQGTYIQGVSSMGCHKMGSFLVASMDSRQG